MRRLLCSLLALTMMQLAFGAQSLNIDPSDRAKLQRGARIFMNYCSGCHSLRYLRYNRMAEDLGLITPDGQLDRALLINNLVFTSAKISDPIQIAMPSSDAREWFGMVPPDLSLTARERGAKWIYTYLNSFYIDKSRPFGANNLLVPEVAMPNVLAPLQVEGAMSQQQFEHTLEDLVTFLVYVGEPVQLVRYRMGLKVLAFLILILLVAYPLTLQRTKN